MKKEKWPPLEKLVAQMRGELIVSIGSGDFNNTCWRWADTMIRYGIDNKIPTTKEARKARKR